MSNNCVYIFYGLCQRLVISEQTFQRKVLKVKTANEETGFVGLHLRRLRLHCWYVLCPTVTRAEITVRSWQRKLDSIRSWDTEKGYGSAHATTRQYDSSRRHTPSTIQQVSNQSAWENPKHASLNTPSGRFVSACGILMTQKTCKKKLLESFMAQFTRTISFWTMFKVVPWRTSWLFQIFRILP